MRHEEPCQAQSKHSKYNCHYYFSCAFLSLQPAISFHLKKECNIRFRFLVLEMSIWMGDAKRASVLSSSFIMHLCGRGEAKQAFRHKTC